MRAPPDVDTMTSGFLSVTALSAARATFSPTTEPIDPPMKKNSIAAIKTGIPPTVPDPTRTASELPTFSSALFNRSR